MQAIAQTKDIQVGDFITIPAWKTFGCVTKIEASEFGSDDCVKVTLEEDPEGLDVNVYRICNGEFIFED